MHPIYIAYDRISFCLYRLLAEVKNPALLLSFGAHLRALRRQRGLSQQALADEADIGWATVQRLEAGNQSATLEVLAALAQALELSLPDLLRFPEEDQTQAK
ncbi:helix-turn-helix domain-containing protein [Hymenobacter cheonanensis]|uniref:helix-turn-helix domain-containing protein n=1 Tax=Hymenobacter sp. CA2-7 TaxID=3063993 RepID=UPI00271248FD|nr:helix-turn-helix domain-containing protein [Hymenobacter sp. CA2-7]MDO7884241.1 helix-turn-helix domain-containing protein [Hymenobacter sp. CA2-7]